MGTEKQQVASTIQIPKALYQSFMCFAFTPSELWNAGCCFLLAARNADKEHQHSFMEFIGKWMACFPDDMRDDFIRYAKTEFGIRIHDYKMYNVKEESKEKH